jgi:hypothetical protein
MVEGRVHDLHFCAVAGGVDVIGTDAGPLLGTCGESAGVVELHRRPTKDALLAGGGSVLLALW